ncbi:hypothetical protein RchiOBHm_Chr4g0389351 [Rosa chinensis]|uniref:Uncharacterized protein n=1 Tax=Rosa chinensis TaxID=74649 RepID=A0A2P6QQ20_ROSCH|nr:hypothetical protein RchiOBHm_Chr4g0389351 [Rosa chinensis]
MQHLNNSLATNQSIVHEQHTLSFFNSVLRIRGLRYKRWFLYHELHFNCECH